MRLLPPTATPTGTATVTPTDTATAMATPTDTATATATPSGDTHGRDDFLGA